MYKNLCVLTNIFNERVRDLIAMNDKTLDTENQYLRSDQCTELQNKRDGLKSLYSMLDGLKRKC
jgi:hypothetical protein